MAIDWNGPLEAVHVSGKVQSVQLEANDPEVTQGLNDEYVIVDRLDSGCGYGPSVFLKDGTPWIGDGELWSAWTIRNRGQ